jgi:hypothetical protein
MTDKPSSPFTGLGLDKALLRSTKQQAAPDIANQQEEREPAPTEAPAPPPASPQENATRRPASKRASNSDNKHANVPASKQASVIVEESAIIEAIRKVVKAPGKEVSFVRLSPDEKGELADIVYTYKRQGKKTSENEINRIALNYILQDYKANGENSILAKVIAALIA